MEHVGLGFKDRRLIYKLYINERVVIMGENETYKESEILKGIRLILMMQLFATLFNLYIEEALKDLRDKNIEGINGILVQLLFC